MIFDIPISRLLPTARVWAVWSDIREAVVYCSPRKSDCVCWCKYCANGYACNQLYIVRMDLSPIYGGRKEIG